MAVNKLNRRQRAQAQCASAPSSKPRRWARSTGPSAARRSVSSWTRRTRESSRACARRDELALNGYRLNHEFALHIFGRVDEKSCSFSGSMR